MGESQLGPWFRLTADLLDTLHLDLSYAGADQLLLHMKISANQSTGVIYYL